MQEFGPVAAQPQSESMSDAEAQEVLRLHLRRTEGMPQLSVTDVAEAIHLPENQVRQLLQEVREQKLAQELYRAAPETQIRKKRDKRLALIAAIAFLTLLGTYLLIVNRAVIFSQNVKTTETTAGRHDSSSFISTDAGEITAAPNNGPGVQATLFGVTWFIPANLAPSQVAQSDDLYKVITREVEDRLVGVDKGKVHEADCKRILDDLKQGNWDTQGITHDELVLQIGDITVNESMPHHRGSTPELEDFLVQAREQRIKDLLQTIAAKGRLER